MANNEQYAVTTWGKPQSFEFTTPSGQVCLMRRLEVEDLVELGTLSDVDRLTNLVNDDHIQPTKGRGQPQDRLPKKLTAAQVEKQHAAMMQNIISNKEDFRLLSWVMDGIVCSAVMEPHLVTAYLGARDDATRIPVEGRHPGLIYADSVPFNDRMAIMNTALGGLEDLARFREGSEQGVGDLEGQPGDAMPSERPVEDIW